jgi:hypothetical protein
MAFNKAPSHWIPSWAEDGTAVTFPIASFAEMDAAEADGASGDIRKVMFAIVEHMYATFIGKVVADRPTQFTMSKSVSQNTTTGIITNTYQLVFRNEILSQDVADEPT